MQNRRRTIEWNKILEVLFVLLIMPAIIFYLIGLCWPVFLNYAYYFLVWLFVFQAGLSYLYSLSAFRRGIFKELPTAKHVHIPKTTFIVSAYLRNETNVIEDTILNILEHVQRPQNGIELIIAYNVPHMEEIELRLRELAYKWQELILANAYGSKTKSENLNYALEIASGEMIVLLDADHLVAPDCLKLAWRWLDEGYDAVQGRCKIRNGRRSMVSALVEVEFEAIYGISHYAKSKLFSSTLFGGTNGYWRSSVIKQLKFDPERLTEDIDTTLRAILQGNHIVHDRNIISTELAPVTMTGLWFQRKRWAQGWLQCSLKYQKAILKSKLLNIFQKFMWTTFLMWRVVYDILSQLLLPVVFAFWLTRGKIELPMDSFIWFALFFVMLSGPFESLAAYKNASSPRAPAWQYIYYAFLAFWYTLFKNLIQVVAIRDEFLGKREWVISRREI